MTATDLTLIDEIDDWLKDRGVTSFGRSFDIIKDNHRRLAAEWFARQYEAFEAYRSGYAGDPGCPRCALVDQQFADMLRGNLPYLREQWRTYGGPDDEQKFVEAAQKRLGGEPYFWQHDVPQIIPDQTWDPQREAVERFERNAMNRLLGRPTDDDDDYPEVEAEKSLFQMVWGRIFR